MMAAPAAEDASTATTLVEKLKTMLRRAKAKLSEQDAVIKDLRASAGPAFGLQPPITVFATCPRLAAVDSSDSGQILLLQATTSSKLGCTTSKEFLAHCAPEWIESQAGMPDIQLQNCIDSAPKLVYRESEPSGSAEAGVPSAASLQARLATVTAKLAASQRAIDRSESDFRRYRVKAESKLRQTEIDLQVAMDATSASSASREIDIHRESYVGMPPGGAISGGEEEDDDDNDASGSLLRIGSTHDVRSQMRQWRRLAKRLQAQLDSSHGYGVSNHSPLVVGEEVEDDDIHDDELVDAVRMPTTQSLTDAVQGRNTATTAAAADAAAAGLEAQHARDEYAAYRRRAQSTLQAARTAQAAAEDEAARLRSGSAAYATRCAILESRMKELETARLEDEAEERVAMAAVEAVAGGVTAPMTPQSTTVAVLTSSALRGSGDVKASASSVSSSAAMSGSDAGDSTGTEAGNALGVARARLGYLRHSLLRYMSTLPSDTAVRRQLEDALIAMIAPTPKELDTIRASRAQASSLSGMVSSLFA